MVTLNTHSDDDKSQDATFLVSELDWKDRLTPKRLPTLLNGLRESIGALDGRYHDALYGRLSVIAAVVAYLQEHASEWRKFCELEEWARAKRKRPNASADGRTSKRPKTNSPRRGSGRNGRPSKPSKVRALDSIRSDDMSALGDDGDQPRTPNPEDMDFHICC